MSETTIKQSSKATQTEIKQKHRITIFQKVFNDISTSFKNFYELILVDAPAS